MTVRVGLGGGITRPDPTRFGRFGKTAGELERL
jgi:hypothetical protein